MRVTKELIRQKSQKLPVPANNRGELNPGSTATPENWGWHDFSRAIECYCLAYAATMPLPNLSDYPHKVLNQPSKTEMAIFVAENECGLNYRFAKYGPRSQIFETLTHNGQSYLHKMIRDLVCVAAMEVDTGYPCQPRIIYGLADIAYPQILPIVRQRIIDGARDEQKL